MALFTNNTWRPCSPTTLGSCLELGTNSVTWVGMGTGGCAQIQLGTNVLGFGFSAFLFSHLLFYTAKSHNSVNSFKSIKNVHSECELEDGWVYFSGT